MSDIILQRNFSPAIDRDVIKTMVADGAACMQTHRVQWLESYLAQDGRRFICHDLAPDAEALRSALRSLSMGYEAIWPATLHASPNAGEANIMVERQFAEPTGFAALQALEDEAAQCLNRWDVTFICSYFSRDQKSMLCLYQAPDAESVRQAQREAGMPFEQVWAFDYVTPQNL